MALPDAKHRLNQVEAIIETYQFDSMHFPIEFRSISLRYSRFLLVATPAHLLIAQCSSHQRAHRVAISRVVLYQYSQYCSTNERNIFIENTCNRQSMFREQDFPLHLCPLCRCIFRFTFNDLPFCVSHPNNVIKSIFALSFMVFFHSSIFMGYFPAPARFSVSFDLDWHTGDLKINAKNWIQLVSLNGFTHFIYIFIYKFWHFAYKWRN